MVQTYHVTTPIESDLNKQIAYKKLKYWFDKDLAILLADKIRECYSLFDAAGFIKEIEEGTKSPELKDRVELIEDQLQAK